MFQMMCEIPLFLSQEKDLCEVATVPLVWMRNQRSKISRHRPEATGQAGSASPSEYADQVPASILSYAL